jgi:alkylation response protein AidB-like acyl-CoA dehydrogenase
MAAVITAAQMAGAMDAVLEITVRYSGDRVQFGRPIGKFQAVQQQLSVLAELVSASRMAAELGCRETGPGTSASLVAAIAKARSSEAAERIVSIAHAVHAAMGITEEYDLQLFTRRLIEWRNDYGSAGYWNRRVGDAVLATDEANTLEFMLSAFFQAAAPARKS